MKAWIDGHARGTVDVRDRGLQYGDGVFETMRVRRRSIRLLDYHLERLGEGCRRLAIRAPNLPRLRSELERIAAQRADGILKLIVTRGSGVRGYRPSGTERTARMIYLQALPAAVRHATLTPVQLRMCATLLGSNPALAGLKTLNRLESVLARAEWTDLRIWEGLMRDTDANIVCGTMSNVFVRRGSTLTTPLLDRCGIAGVMRRWVLEQAVQLEMRTALRRLRWGDLRTADEVFMTNAVVGIVSVAAVHNGRRRIGIAQQSTAAVLRARLALL